MKIDFRCLLAIALSMAAGIVFADAPGPLAPADDKLDYMLSSWEGRTRDELQQVWGRELEVQRRGGNKVHVFERTVKVRASVFSGISIYNGGLKCMAYFEVDDEGVIVRTARRGGGKECWNAFRRNEPR